MYYKISDFIKEWTFESDSTLKVLSSLTDASLKFKAYKEGRTLGYIAWHLAATITEMFAQAKIKLGMSLDESKEPTEAVEIYNAYQKATNALVNYIDKTWKDEHLKLELEMYGQKWTRSEMLDSLVKHQIHHRGQLTILMRQAGLPVPGIYGPSKEEWKEMGMEAMK